MLDRRDRDVCVPWHGRWREERQQARKGDDGREKVGVREPLGRVGAKAKRVVGGRGVRRRRVGREEAEGRPTREQPRAVAWADVDQRERLDWVASAERELKRVLPDGRGGAGRPVAGRGGGELAGGRRRRTGGDVGLPGPGGRRRRGFCVERRGLGRWLARGRGRGERTTSAHRLERQHAAPEG